MKIASYNIEMYSQRTYLEKYEKNETMKMWVGDQRPDFEGNQKNTNPLQAEDFVLDLSGQTPTAVQSTPTTAPSDGIELSEKDKLKIALIEQMIEILTGKKIKILTLKKLKAQGEHNNPHAQAQAAQVQAAQAAQKKGWGLEYDSHEMRYEREQTSFASQGVIKTADGREISFSLEMNMSREFMQHQDVSIRAGDAVKIDPLVINYDGPATGLTDTKFSFDLDSDGDAELISFVKPGSGFLALDLNGDGVINNGAELFGPQTGNGFADLAKYDVDNNQWIDENDPIYDKLRIWSKDAQGNDELVVLGQKGIGAIYLGQVGTEFALKDSLNQLQGQVSRTGIYVKENGMVGTVQQVDLTV